MTPEPRTDATSRDRSPEQQYTLLIEETAELYAKAGHPRTLRAIQKYCALSKLDCHKVETATGEKYLVAPYSVERHIAYINEVRTVANGRDQTRTDASVRPLENKAAAERGQPAPSGEQTRTAATIPQIEDRYVTRLEDEMDVKDRTIGALLERDRETNILVSQLQRMLGPLLPAPKQKEMPHQPADETPG